MTNDLVSIIIPVYNVAPYLDRCVQSACNQTYRNIEIILVDDGSTDESGEMCDRWAEKDSRVRVVHKKNGGLSDARNTGLDIAHGKYILFLDSDDSVKHDLLNATLPYMTDNADVVAFGYTLVFDNKELQKVAFSKKTYHLETEEDQVNFIINPFFKHELGWNAWNRVFLKSIIDKNNLRFVDNSRIFAEDQCFNLMYLSHCKNVVVIEDCLYDYYQREDSIMGFDKKDRPMRFGKKNELAIEVFDHFSRCENSKCFLKYFPFIHYLLLERPIVIFEEYYKKDIKKLRGLILADVDNESDIAFLYKDLELVNEGSIKKLIKDNYGFLHMLEKTGRAKWLLTGRSFWYTVLVKWRKRLENIFKKNTNN